MSKDRSGTDPKDRDYITARPEPPDQPGADKVLGEQVAEGRKLAAEEAKRAEAEAKAKKADEEAKAKKAGGPSVFGHPDDEHGAGDPHGKSAPSSKRP